MSEPRYELCIGCGNKTGRAGRADDSIFAGLERAHIGPLCEECRDDVINWAYDYAEADLLTACEALIIRYDAPGGPAITDQVNAMRAAIAKARGLAQREGEE